MAKSILDITINLTKAELVSAMQHKIALGMLSINEARTLSKSPGVNFMQEVNKHTCEYCRRPNNIDRDLCQSCGATLPILHYRNEL